MPFDAPPLYVPRSGSHPPNPETSSIHSAAPSYHSATPSYHSTLTIPICIPRNSPSNKIRPPPLLHNFRIAPWSNATTQNPKNRHYERVANRRSKQVISSGTKQVISSVLSSIVPEEDGGLRKENEGDKELGGEEAGEREERLARERKAGDEVLLDEDKRWDFMINQMADWEQRERCWKKYKEEVLEGGKSGKLARAIGVR